MNRHTQKRRSAFTLTELLVAIGLIVVLMLAVNMIFSTTADTISSGQALSAGMRDLRSVQTIIKKDLDGAAIADAPFFIIRSTIQPAFMNRKDQLADTDYSEGDAPLPPTMPNRLTEILSADVTGSGAETAQPIASYGIRTFRQDTLSLFSRGLFRRQTGNDGVFNAPMTSDEAFINYGHLYLPDNAGTPMMPGFTLDFTAANCYTAANNPNNFCASQWMLGRNQVLLVNKGSGVITDNSSPAQSQTYINRANGYAAAGPDWTDLDPLQPGSVSVLPAIPPTAPQVPLWYSRYDLAATTIDLYRRAVANYITSGTSPSYYEAVVHRFAANPFPTRPLSAASAAVATPIFVPNCSEFVVEFAGDFTVQDPNTGYPTSAGSDGTVDWVVVGLQGLWSNATAYAVGDVVWDAAPATKLYRCIQANTNQALTNTTYWQDITGNPTRAIRWYGMPRSVTPAGRIQPYQDVVPVRDLAGAVQGFEHLTNLAQVADYSSALAVNASYVCAWGPDVAATVARPKMLRILIKPEDPNGKINLPWQEMVFTLPQ